MKRLLLIALLLWCSPVSAKSLDQMDSNTVPATNDLLYTQDVSDTSEASTGTGKKATPVQLFKGAADMTVSGVGGNIGINSTAPGAKVDVVGTVRATAFSGDGSGLSNVAGAVSDAAYSASWDGDTTTPASKNSIYDKIETIATGSGGWTDGGTNVYVSTSTDKVGIGSTTPRSKLDVIGAGYFDDTVTVGGSSQIQFTTNGETISNTNDGYNDFSGGITTVGNIGVGTITASSRLTVSGTATATAFSGPLTGNVTGNASTATALAVDPTGCSAGDYVSDIAANGTLTCGTPAGTGGGGWTDAGTDIYNTSTSDNVGIGTTTPTSKLTVAGSITTSGTTAGSVVLSEASANGTDTITLSSPDSVAASKAFTLPSSYGSNGDVLTSDGAGALSFTTPASASGGWTDGGTNVYTTTTTDTVGIGTTTPTASLLIENVGSGDSFRINDLLADATPFIVDAAGNIGIGTSTSSRKLDLISSATTASALGVTANSITSASVLIVSSSNSTHTANVGSFTQSGNFSGNVILATASGATNTGNAIKATQSGNGLVALLEDTSNDASPFIINADGNVGIGTTTAGAILSIPSIKSSSGTRYLCIDSSGNVSSSASACSGT